MAKELKTAFVLAAGRGERLRPLTDSTPKPLLPIQGRPLLDSILGNLLSLNLERVVFNAWHLKEQVLSYVKDRQRKFPFEMLVSEEPELLGTGGGLKLASKFFKKNEPLLMVNGDCYWSGNIKDFVARSLNENRSSVWWLTDASKDQTEIHVQSKEIVQIGKLWKKNGDFPNTKIGCFTGIQLIQKLDASKLPQKGCILRDYWLKRLQEGETLGADFEGLKSWTDIGTPERYKTL